MKRKSLYYYMVYVVLCAFMMLSAGCNQVPKEQEVNKIEQSELEQEDLNQNIIEISLSDDGIQVDGKPIEKDSANAVYTANDIIYYESGKDFTYGEGSEKDAHSAKEAAAHTVVHITKAGTYSISGTLSRGQIAVDLGEDAKKDSNAVVTLIMNGVDITCEVAPAVIFYNVYECGSYEAELATKDVDTSAAGANVIIADGTTNTVNGSYVEKIYVPDSVVLNDDKTEVEDAKKLHKYDGAFYSKMSMNVTGEQKKDGILNITGTNEGLDSELHLTINGGTINIKSGNDGINTSEDGLSVVVINDGNVTVTVTGETGEGDGIDSNGWLVINGGTVNASACAKSADAGIDADRGIHVNGGTVIASGHMLDRIEEGGQTYAVFTFAQEQSKEDSLQLKDEKGSVLADISQENAYAILVYSSADLVPGTYTLWNDDKQLAGRSGDMMGEPGMSGMRPEGMPPFEGGEVPEGMPPFEGGEVPEGMPPFEGGDMPERIPSFEGKEPPEGMEMPEISPSFDRADASDEKELQELTFAFIINEGANMFNSITHKE